MKRLSRILPPLEAIVIVVFFLLVFFMMASLAMTIYQGLPVIGVETEHGFKFALRCGAVAKPLIDDA